MFVTNAVGQELAVLLDRVPTTAAKMRKGRCGGAVGLGIELSTTADSTAAAVVENARSLVAA